MKAVIESKIHNRFDIEVRDAKTGKLKQKGQAENIILNRMYERLCNFNSYFTYIHFGSGTGEPLSTRNTLFSKLGHKTATTEEVVKDFPVSKWVRTITINPEEYVGKTLTEVGISDSTSYINTHALIKDAEGNPLSIVKTDIDVIIIYATVFIELQNKSENIYFCNLRYGNELLNYLTGDSAPSRNIRVGKRWTKGDMFDENVISDKTATFTADVNNKKSILTVRFGITEGNGDIAEIEAFRSVRVMLPEPLVFTEHSFRDVNMGIGDGIRTAFNIPHIRAEDIVVKVNEEITDDYIVKNVTNCNFKMQEPTMEGTVNGAAIYQDTIVVATSASPYFTVLKLNEDTGLYEKVQELTGVGGNGQRVAMHQDTIVTVSWSSPYFTIHRLNEDTGLYEKVQNLTGTSDRGRDAAIYQDTIVTIAGQYTPSLTLHRLNKDTGLYEKVRNLTNVEATGGVAIYQDTIVAVSPLTVYKLNEDTGLYEKVQELTSVGGNVAIYQDTIVVTNTDSPYLTLHRLNEDTGLYEKVQELTNTGQLWGVGIYQDTIAVASGFYTPLKVYNAEPTAKKIIFNTPPPNEAIITADYKVPYIPKSKDYVLDVTAEIQFAEGV